MPSSAPATHEGHRSAIYPHLYCNRYGLIIMRLLLVLIFMQLSRIGFYLYNKDLFEPLTWQEFWPICLHGTRFDLTAIGYLNIPYILLALLPIRGAWGRITQRIANYAYGLINSLMLIANLAEMPFYRFTGMRTQAVHLNEILGDSGTIDMLMGHLITYWELLIGGGLFIAAFLLIAFWLQPQPPAAPPYSARRIAWSGVATLLILGGTFIGMRGHLKKGKPIGVADAALYCQRNKEVALVLNTPFSILRTLGEDNTLPRYTFHNAEQLATLRNDIHEPNGRQFLRKNVVQIILEGVGNTFIEAFNPYCDSIPVASHRLTPFLNELASKSLIFTDFYTHLRKSSSGITALLGGMPAYNPFIYILSPYQGNEVETAVSLLGEEGYESIFFCGCNKGSYGLTALAKAFGFDRVYDRVNYEAEYGQQHYDGHWGIYDHAMAEVLLTELNRMQEPFFASWFTLNTHGPYTLPADYPKAFNAPDQTMQQAVEYIDDVLRNLFHKAAKEPWFDHTIFLITADHGHKADEPFYDNSAQLNRIPLMIYTPDGSLPSGVSERIGGQIDIIPTLLTLLQYDKPYFSLGNSMLEENQGGGFCVFDDQNDYICVAEDHMLRMAKHDLKPLALYRYKSDPMLEEDCLHTEQELADRLWRRATAFLQDYTERVTENRMRSTHE